MMKIKRIIWALVIVTLISSTYVFAKPPKMPIFMGEILEVQKGDNEKSVKLVVDGYINDCEVYKNKIVAIVNEETKMRSGCEEGDKKVEFKKGDKVFIIFNEQMTKSNPPQGTARMIKVTTNP